MSNNGFTTKDAVPVHPSRWYLDCTCGGTVLVEYDGELVSHSELKDEAEEEHVVVPFWSKSIWRYQIVE